MKKIFTRWLALAPVALILVATGRAGIVSTVTGTVAYTPPSFVFEGTLSTTAPLTESYPLVIVSPSTLVTGVTVPITLQATSTSTPAGVSSATALSFLSFSTTSLSFTGPNQSIQVIVTLTIAPGTFAGNYSWTVHTAGWPLSLGTVVDGIGGVGTTINANVAPAGAAAQAPVVSLTSPASGQVFTVVAGSTTAAVPYAVTGSTPVGSVFAAPGSASLTLAQAGGAAVSGFAPIFTLVGVGGVNTGITSAGSVNLSAGTYTFNATATNNTGVTAVASPITFTVVGPPTLTITAPTAGQIFTAAAGSTTAAVPYTISGATAAGSTFPTNTSASATLALNGASVAAFAPVFTGAGTAAISAAGTANLAPGTYTLAASATNSAGLTAAATTVTFTVNAAPAAPTESLVWLQNNNCGYSGGGPGNSASVTQQTVTGGTVAPVVFALYTSSDSAPNGCGDRGDSSRLTFVNDPSTEIAIYEVLSNTTSSTPLIYTYGANGPNPPFFSIGSSEYLLNFPTAGGRHHYVVEVYHPGAGGALQLLGTDDLYTSGSCLPQDSSLQASFTNTAIASGNTIWFSSIVNLSNVSPHAATLLFDNSTLTFSVKGVPVTLAVPAAAIKFDPAATTASTVFNASTQSWVTIVPANYSGNVFLSGLAYVVPAGFSSNLSSVTWTGDFRSDTGAIAAKWQWSAAVYTKFGSALTAIAVKPVAANNLSAYANSDPAGTPENFKSFVIAGARGVGGSDTTGSYTNAANAAISSDCWQSSGCSGNDDGDRSGDGGNGGCGF